MKKPATFVLYPVLCLPLIGCTPASVDEPLGNVPDFTLTERSGRTIHRQDLQGKVWVAAFIFTRCAGPCTQISGVMARLQRDLEHEKNVVLVSFSVDPEYDRPEVLQKYAAKYGADSERWLFLTEPSSNASSSASGASGIYALLRDGFHVGAGPNQGADRKPGNEVWHDTHLVVVDGQGRIREYIAGTEPQAAEQVEAAVRKLPVRSILPEVNAFLNGTSAVLLVFGYACIKRRQVLLHKVSMLAALATSAAFLACYLIYHYLAGEKTSQFSRDPAWIWWAYILILVSHSILAAAVAPLAIYTAYQGLRDRLPQHVRLARWTLPIWLYVSITGVVVYWMLYRLYPSP
jgi:uncharacterized membrane protein YozB (DUF420 family)